MAKIFLLLFFVVLIVIKTQGLSKSGHCPLKDSVSNCTPKCTSDYDTICKSTEKCCPNKCGTKSCATAGGTYTGSRYKGGNSGVYCGNVKCGPYEKCEFDRSSKREKCVRT